MILHNRVFRFHKQCPWLVYSKPLPSTNHREILSKQIICRPTPPILQTRHLTPLQPAIRSIQRLLHWLHPAHLRWQHRLHFRLPGQTICRRAARGAVCCTLRMLQIRLQDIVKRRAQLVQTIGNLGHGTEGLDGGHEVGEGVEVGDVLCCDCFAQDDEEGDEGAGY